MKAVWTDKHALHDPQFFLVRGRSTRSAEQAARASVLKDGALAAGLAFQEAEDFGLGPISAIHKPDYLVFLEEASEQWLALDQASEEVIPNVHPNRDSAASYPSHIVGRAGWHQADTACPIGPGTYRAACASAHVAVTAAELLLDGEESAYALCRPPGHHAFADMAGGFCFLNNAAIAAQHLRQAYERVAIIDIDVHHGNGTQGIFYDRGDVLTLSLHADPNQFYPFFWGHAAERGAGDGTACNLNIPLPLGTGDEGWLERFEAVAIPHLKAFAPQALVIALGLDAYEKDPLAGLKITTEGFQKIGTRLAKISLPTLLVQEGGYLSSELGENLASFLSSFQEAK